MSGFKQKLERGNTWEKFVAEMFRSNGYYVIPSYDYSGREEGKAPKMLGNGRGVILPDLDVSKGGRRFWVEVKNKSEPSFYKKEKRDVHGIPIRHWEAYNEIQEITGCPVVLCVVEAPTQYNEGVEPKAILKQYIDILASDAREWRGNVGKGYKDMIYFPRDLFKVVGGVVHEKEKLAATGT